MIIERIGALAVVVMLALVSNPVSSRADEVCGNGDLDGPEECDDGNVTPGDGCSDVCKVESCAPAPVSPCFDASQARLLVKEEHPGKERLKVQWANLAQATTQSDYGDPVSGTPTTGQSSICIYDDSGTLVVRLRVAAAGEICTCFGPCWKATTRGGYLYRDCVGYHDGVNRIQYIPGPAGRGKTSAAGSNDLDKGTHRYLPVGIAAALAGSVSPTIQLITTEGFCVGATMNAVKTADGVVYGAQKK